MHRATHAVRVAAAAHAVKRSVARQHSAFARNTASLLPSAAQHAALGQTRWCTAAAKAKTEPLKEEEKKDATPEPVVPAVAEKEKKAEAEEEEEEEKTPLQYEIERRAKDQEKSDRRVALIKEHTKGAKSSFEDVTEFLEHNASTIVSVREAIKNSEEKQKTILEFGVMFGGWVVQKGVNTKTWLSQTKEERAETKAAKKAKRSKHKARADENMASFYQSQELINLMKLKAVTYDSGKEPDVPVADFEGFSRRICDNYDLFKRTKAYSNMEFHVVRDPSKSEKKFESAVHSNYKQIDEGGLTSWLTQEGGATTTTEETAEPTPLEGEGVVRPSPFRVDYETGEVTILDTCSPDEFLDFLQREAPRAEIRQEKLQEEQVKMYEELTEVAGRVGLKSIVFNNGNSVLTDREYKVLRREGREADYVLPADVMAVVKELNSKQRLYAKHLKGVNLRILPTATARAYYIDERENEVCLPSDFHEDTFLPLHKKARRMQKLENFIRSLKYLGCVIVITLLGDVEWPAPSVLV